VVKSLSFLNFLMSARRRSRSCCLVPVGTRLLALEM
jgi:hypothetical protein